MTARWTNQTESGHSDYRENLRYAEYLQSKEDTSAYKLNGLRVKISDSEHLKKALLIISWSPGNTVKKGNYATPIFLHQYKDEFKKTADNVLRFYKKAMEGFTPTDMPRNDLLPTHLKV